MSLSRRRFLVAGAALGAAFAHRRALAGPPADPPLDPPLAAALADVAKARAKLTTLQGPFTQVRTVALLAAKVTSTGKMWLVRPDRLRWQLDPPDAATYWVLPDALAYQTQSGSGKIAKGSQGPLGGVLGDLLVLLGGDLAQLSTRYALTLVRRDAAGLVVHATPRDKQLAKTTRRVELELASDLVGLQKVTIVEVGDDRSEIVFGMLARNAPVEAKLVAGP